MGDEEAALHRCGEVGELVTASSMGSIIAWTLGR